MLRSSIHLHLGSQRSTTPLRRLFLLSFSAGWWKTWRKGHEKQRKVLKLLEFRGLCITIFDWKFMLSRWKSRWLRACTSQSKPRRNCYVVHDLSFGQDFLIARNSVHTYIYLWKKKIEKKDNLRHFAFRWKLFWNEQKPKRVNENLRQIDSCWRSLNFFRFPKHLPQCRFENLIVLETDCVISLSM